MIALHAIVKSWPTIVLEIFFLKWFPSWRMSPTWYCTSTFLSYRQNYKQERAVEAGWYWIGEKMHCDNVVGDGSMNHEGQLDQWIWRDVFGFSRCDAKVLLEAEWPNKVYGKSKLTRAWLICGQVETPLRCMWRSGAGQTKPFPLFFKPWAERYQMSRNMTWSTWIVFE